MHGTAPLNRCSAAGCHRPGRYGPQLPHPHLIVETDNYRGHKKRVEIEFDGAKDETNIAKHGISLGRAADFDFLAIVTDARFTTEIRIRAFGMIDGASYCLAFTMRGTTLRAISLRRAHAKEMRRYLP
jgi:uncharacterized protein